MTPHPHHPTSGTFHCYPLPIQHPSPLRILIIHWGDSAPLCNFPIWIPMTMKFGDVVLCQHLYQEIIKHLMTSLLWRFYDVMLYFRLLLGKKVENSNFFVFYLSCLKFGIGGNFEMLITKIKCKLKLEKDWSKKLQFSTDFSQNFSTVALPWQQWMSHGIALYSEFSPISIK